MKPAKFERGEKSQLNEDGKDHVKDIDFESESEVVVSSIFTNPNDTTDYLVEDIDKHEVFVNETELEKLYIKRIVRK